MTFATRQRIAGQPWITQMNNDALTSIADFGLHSGELRLVTVGPEWALRFAAEHGRLATVLGPDGLAIEHVGSTAIAGILAKPILDIAIAIDSFEGGAALVPRIEALGYQYRGENGIALRHYFVQGTPRRTHHLHMLELRSAEWERHLRFRDRLLASPTMAARYSELKLAICAQCAGSRDLYQHRKSSFIEEFQHADARPDPLCRLRRAQQQDLVQLPAIERAAGTLLPAGRIADIDDTMPAAELENAMNNGLLFVVAAGMSVVGFAMAQQLDGHLHLAVMAVQPDHGRRGLGRSLVRAILAEAAARQYPGVTLTAFADLPWNGPFYRNAGFRVLSNAELSPSLQTMLAHEASLGMANRVAMHHAINQQA